MNLNDSNNAAQVHVFFLNAILAHATDYGAFLLPGKRLSLVDANGLSPFTGIDNGTIDYSTVKSVTLNGKIYNFNRAEVAGVVHAEEPAGTLVANTVYSFRLRQWNPYTKNWIVATITYNTFNGAPITTGSASAAWLTQVANAGFFVTQATSVGNRQLDITATAGYPVITVEAPLNITLPAATVGVTSIGHTEGTNNNLGDLWYANTAALRPFSSYTGYNNALVYDICTFQAVDNNGNTHIFNILINTGDASYGVPTPGSTTLFVLSFLTNILELGAASPTAALLQGAVTPQNITV